MNKMLENRMVLPYADDDPIDEPQEREYDKHLDPEDYADLRAELVAITRLQSLTSRIEDLTKELQSSALPRRK